MKTISYADIAELIFGFEDKTLPKEKWTHEAHLLVALWYLVKYPKAQAIKKIRDGIVAYNIARGGENTDHSGFHETLTMFWIWVVENHIMDNPDAVDLYELAEELVESKSIDPRFPLEYYSPGVLFSVKARKGWVEPDLKPLRRSAKKLFGFSLVRGLN